MEIKTIYKRYQVLVSILCFLFFTSVAVLIYNQSDPFDSFGKAYLLPLMLILFAIFFPYLLLQKCPRAVFDDEFISAKYLFGSATEDWPSVQEIRLSSKESFTVFFIFSQTLEATTIIFNNGEKLVLWEDMYQNLAAIREFLAKKAPDKIKDPQSKLVTNNLRSVGMKKYAGNPYTSFNTALIAGFVAVVLIGAGKAIKFNSSLVVLICFTLLLYLFLGMQMNYFIIDEDVLIIRNHYFPWKKVVIKLSDIREVTTETPYRRSRSLRVLSGRFNSRLFGAGSLRDEDWSQLMKDLKFVGVAVRDEG